VTHVPAVPAEFFGEYVPEQLSALRSSLGEISSPGAVVFDLGSGGAWSLRLVSGKLSVTTGIDPDPLVRLTLSEADFALVVVAGAERLANEAGGGRVLMAARVLTLDAERARMLRDAPGSVAVKLTSAAGEHRLTMTLGRAEPRLDAPDCELECTLEDLWAIQSGSKNPFELLLDGKLRMTGKVELAMALGSALG
jgi:hypothetical protein